MAIDRCFCHKVPFTQLKQLIDNGVGDDIDELSRQTRCGTSCGICLPYIKLVIQTGQTSLPVLSTQQFEALADQVKAERDARKR